jgi:hypothetical protein
MRSQNSQKMRLRRITSKVERKKMRRGILGNEGRQCLRRKD